MRWFLVAMVVLMARYAGAGVCTGVPDGAQCLLSDNATAGVCVASACTRTFTVPAGEARTGTGTVSSSGATVTGSGTVFTTELQVGDTLIAGGQRVAVTAITSDTSCLTDPSFNPVQSAANFTFANPVQKFLDESGNTLGLVDARGLVAFGQRYANEALTIIGPVETSAGTQGKGVTISGGVGGQAGGGLVGGNGGQININGNQGGSSASATLSSGNGAPVVLSGGYAGNNTGGGPVGQGGDAIVRGAPSNSTGNPGRAILRGGISTGVRGDILICDDNSSGASYTLKIGGALLTVDCLTGAFTKIRNVSVSNFPPANAAGFMKNDGSGNYSLTAVATSDLPAAARNAINAFVHANAGGI